MYNTDAISVRHAVDSTAEGGSFSGTCRISCVCLCTYITINIYVYTQHSRKTL